MNRSRSSSRALGRSHCTHLRERREGGVGGGGVGWEKRGHLSHVACLHSHGHFSQRGGESAQNWDSRLPSEIRIHGLIIEQTKNRSAIKKTQPSRRLNTLENTEERRLEMLMCVLRVNCVFLWHRLNLLMGGAL